MTPEMFHRLWARFAGGPQHKACVFMQTLSTALKAARNAGAQVGWRRDLVSTGLRNCGVPGEQVARLSMPALLRPSDLVVLSSHLQGQHPAATAWLQQEIAAGQNSTEVLVLHHARQAAVAEQLKRGAISPELKALINALTEAS